MATRRKKRKSVIELSSAYSHQQLAMFIVTVTPRTLLSLWLGNRSIAVISDRHGDMYPVLVNKECRALRQEA